MHARPVFKCRAGPVERRMPRGSATLCWPRGRRYDISAIVFNRHCAAVERKGHGWQGRSPDFFIVPDCLQDQAHVIFGRVGLEIGAYATCLKSRL
jgi:hypothetical protein